MATSAEAPLIANQENHGPDHDEPQHPDDSYGDDTAQDGEPRGEEERKVGIFMWLLAISAGISGLLFGCKFPYLALDIPILASGNTPISYQRMYVY